MKKLIALLLTIGIVGCSKEVPSDQLVKRGGLTYEINSQTRFNGASVSYFESGQLKMKSSYKNGCLDGLHEAYYENGQLKEKRTYQDILDIPMFCSNDLDLEYGFYDGLHVSYYSNGQLKSKHNYKDGKEDGLSETYDYKGRLESISCYKKMKEVDMSYCEK
ncbi:hypothetical protein OAC45_04025 [Gammaproteobacteria bacterium]|nr:hypothetical protein [Gammaproteobacteria bacterium]|tara:strand:- start:129 stop:614 length:486 start_codon:yes stop_codon:yes gene_type:complete